MKQNRKKTLAQRVNCKMLELGLKKRGGQTILAKKIEVNRNSLSMALSEYRTGPGTEQILKKALDALNQWNDSA
jgi:hypothetical protein